MSVNTTPPTRWASKISHAVALVLLAASATMNTAYGWSKGDTLPMQYVWAAIAAGSAIIFTLAWPALSKAIENRNWSAAAVAFVGLLLFGAYNVSAALGSAAGARTNAATVETDTTDTRQKAQASYNTAKAELDTLKTSRPVAELEPLVEAARPVCRIVVTTGSRETVCAKPAALLAEFGRAKRRAQLEATMQKATTDLAANKTKVANSDAKALASYLTGLGFEIDAERVNKWLVLLAVLLVECGAGISMTIGLALSAPAVAAAVNQSGQQEPAAQTVVAAAVSQPGAAPATVASQSGPPVANVVSQNGPTAAIVASHGTVSSHGGSAILTALSHSGGRVESIRKLADHVGRPRSAVTAEVQAMVAGGLVTMARGRHGTVVALARPN